MSHKLIGYDMNDQLNETLLGWVDALNGPLWDF